MKKFLTILLALFALVSCKLSQQYTFNADFSGKYNLQFDLSEMASYGVEDPDSVPNIFEDFNLEVYHYIKKILNDLYLRKKNVSNCKVPLIEKNLIRKSVSRL